MLWALLTRSEHSAAPRGSLRQHGDDSILGGAWGVVDDAERDEADAGGAGARAEPCGGAGGAGEGDGEAVPAKRPAGAPVPGEDGGAALELPAAEGGCAGGVSVRGAGSGLWEWRVCDTGNHERSECALEERVRNRSVVRESAGRDDLRTCSLQELQWVERVE